MPLVVLLLGLPGAGKGTQAELLADRKGLSHVATGKLLRERARERDYTGTKIAETFSKGLLAPTPFVFGVWMGLFEEFKKRDDLPGFVMDGNPRRLYEARLLDQLFGWFEWKNVKAVHLALSVPKAVSRQKERGREDDSASRIENRMNTFERETAPVLEYYRGKGILREVDGDKDPEQVHKELVSALGI